MNTQTPQPNTDPAYLESQGLSPSTPERFLSKIRIDEVTGCWVWTAMLHDGYGYMARGAPWVGPIKSSRVAWILFCGPIPEGFETIHRCPHGHNKACVNFGHLVVGTHALNMSDEKGPKWHQKHPQRQRGEMSSTPKLTQVQVDEIRQKYTGKRGQQSQLAREYGVRQGNIWYIVNHLTW